MEFITLLDNNLIVFISVVALCGLIIGSFLNVVIYRLPRMMKQEWRKECIVFLDLKGHPAPEAASINLLLPRSHCQHCQTTLTWWQNIPLLSYLYLKGQCAHCHQKISLQYPLIETITMVSTAIIAWHYGFSVEAGFLILLTYGLIVLSGIDYHTQLLPDQITLPLLWLGLLINLMGIFATSFDAIIGAVIAYLSLWSISWTYKLFTGRFGMAHGDFKLYAVFGAWFGWQVLPIIILMSSVVALLFASRLFVVAEYKEIRQQQIPYGPYLAIAGWLIMVFPQLNMITL